MSSKKVIIFIVDGTTDEISLGYIVSKLCKGKKVFFQVSNTDITSEISNNTGNIVKKINDQVNECIMQQHFKKSDIEKIVHIVDMDGVYADDSYIKYQKTREVKYNLDGIYTKNVDAIKERNNRKSAILNKLCTTNMIGKIPYEIYYFSTNIEHIMHNIQNAEDESKRYFAEKVEDRFYENPEEFIEFINNKKYAVKGTYDESWDFIKEGNNSLKRYTNFNLFFK